VDLVLHRGAGLDLALAVRGERRLGGHRLIGMGRRSAIAPDQQLRHRSEVAGVALERAHQVLGPALLDLGRVEQGDVVAEVDEPGLKRPVVVPGLLEADPDPRRTALGLGRGTTVQRTSRPRSFKGNENGATTTSPQKSHTSAAAWCLPTSIGTASSRAGSTPRMRSTKRSCRPPPMKPMDDLLRDRDSSEPSCESHEPLWWNSEEVYQPPRRARRSDRQPG
jgi:hypothetical protein